jgi:FkbM family methyltransferase
MKKLVNKILRKLNYEIKPLHNGFSINNNLQWFKNYNFDTIFDIGANEGQFALFTQKIFPFANIFSFEPLSDCFRKIEEISFINKKIKSFNYGLGEKDEELEIFRNNFSPSSSLLKMNSLHYEIFPYTKNHTKEKIIIKKIDSVFKDFEIGKKILMKIDVQGYEVNVLNGAIDFINKYYPLIIIETSYVELYDKEPLFDEIYKKMNMLNYKFIGILDQLYDPNDGKILQGDAMFEKII